MPWILWFLGDSTFWEWARVLIAGAVGALFTFLISKSTQRSTARTAAETQDRANEAQIARDAASWTRESDSRARSDVRADVRNLLEEFTAVHREALAKRPALGEYFEGVRWRQRWKAIWSEERSLNVDVLCDLVVDSEARKELQQVVRLLDNADRISSEGDGPGQTNIDMRSMTMRLASQGIETTARYLRGDPYEVPPELDLTLLDKKLDDQFAYEDHLEKRAEEAAEREYERMQEAERAARPDSPEAAADSV